MTTTALALFDFDGTITARDTMFDFVLATRGPIRLALGLIALSPWLVAHRLGLLEATPAKQRVLRWFFGGQPKEALQRWGEAYAARIEAQLRPGAAARLAWHEAAGHEICVVSASLDLWLAPWARQRGFRVLCTEAAWQDGVFTGSFATPNCNGPEKERRIREALALDAYGTVFAYGDSAGDEQMLALANEVWYRPFRDGDVGPWPPPAAARAPTNASG